ncbi:hypothetical protein PM082_015727 [Marasmius tenuissimus]|nr:hypothetical protein PM082_015727 [Marasmius tenuissimus]
MEETMDLRRDHNVQSGGGDQHVNNNQGGQARSHTVVNVNILPWGNTQSHAAPHLPQDNVHNTLPIRPPEPVSSPQPGITASGDIDEERTRPRSYESLLLRCKLGFPLWMPSPSRMPDGSEYVPEIGDVGFFSHGLPFKTLFNITQPPDNPANRAGIPEGVDPPCFQAEPPNLSTVEHHPPRTILHQPRGAVLRQEELRTSIIWRLLFPFCVLANNILDLDLDTTRSAFKFHLSKEGGALLMLPYGSDLRRLESTAEFKGGIKCHWRQWYKFANEKADLDHDQALYVVTGVERCSARAMAAWDSHPSGESDWLKLRASRTARAHQWRFPPARCSARSLPSPTTKTPSSKKETVFILGQYINRLKERSQPSISPSGSGGETDGGMNGTPNPRGGSWRQPSSGHPSSRLPPSAPSLFDGDGSSGGSSIPSKPQMDEIPILNLNLYFPDDGSSLVVHPCEVINKFALNLVSRIRPALLDTGCVAISHDDDWINIIRESDEEIPPAVETIRRVCSEFKFALEGGEFYMHYVYD